MRRSLGIRQYGVRHSAPLTRTDIPEEPRKRPAAKKDTKHWCRGKVGVKHKPKWGPSEGILGAGWMELRCTACSRKLDYCTQAFAGYGQGCRCGRHRPLSGREPRT